MTNLKNNVSACLPQLQTFNETDNREELTSLFTKLSSLKQQLEIIKVDTSLTTDMMENDIIGKSDPNKTYGLIYDPETGMAVQQAGLKRAAQPQYVQDSRYTHWSKKPGAPESDTAPLNGPDAPPNA